MKNNRILSSILWFFVAVLGIVYLITQEETKELNALSESNTFTENASKLLSKEIELEIEELTFISGRNYRDVALLNKVIKNSLLLDSLHTNGKLYWKDLEKNTFDSIHTRKPSNSILNYTSYSSQKMEAIHQNLLYKFYQTILGSQRAQMGEFQLKLLELSLEKLDSTIYINDMSYQIAYSTSLSPNFYNPKNQITSFDFTKSDTVVFQVVTEFYNNQREKEIKRYKVASKISSPFDYEEIK